MKERKRQIILKAFEGSAGNYTETAKLLGLHPNCPQPTNPQATDPNLPHNALLLIPTVAGFGMVSIGGLIHNRVSRIWPATRTYDLVSIPRNSAPFELAGKSIVQAQVLKLQRRNTNQCSLVFALDLGAFQ